MFFSGFAAIPRQDEGPKKIPPAPKLPEFPRELPEASSLQLNQVFSIRNPRRFTPQHVHTVAQAISDEEDLHNLVPAEFIPPLEWAKEPTTNDSDTENEASVEKLSNGAQAPGRKIFWERVQELQYDSEDVYNELDRKPQPPEAKPIRLSHYRRFWAALREVGGYWDSSRDNVKYDPDTGVPIREPGTEPKPPDTSSEGDGDKTNASTEDKSDYIYTGRRHSVGPDMPNNMREEMARNFIDPVVWTFRCRCEKTTLQPKIFVGNVKIDSTHSGRVFRLPEDSTRNRQGILEGPLMPVFASHETSFRTDGHTSELHRLREVAAALSVAQERSREYEEETIPGQGKWWAEGQRYGGLGYRDAAGEPLIDDFGYLSNERPRSSSQSGSSMLRPRSSNKSPREQRKKQFKMQILGSYEKPRSLWDKKVQYLQIGRPEEDDYDTIFCVSALNHHISLLRIRIHKSFLIWLKASSLGTTNASPQTEKATNEKYTGLEVKRSRWFDLFQPDERVEAMRAVWAATAWLMRETGRQEGCKEPQPAGATQGKRKVEHVD